MPKAKIIKAKHLEKLSFDFEVDFLDYVENMKDLVRYFTVVCDLYSFDLLYDYIK